MRQSGRLPIRAEGERLEAWLLRARNTYQWEPGRIRIFPAAIFWYSEGNSAYHALELDVSRRMGQGLQLRGNFTWSKNLDINSALQGAQANNQAQMVMDRNDLRRDWGPSALNPAVQSSISATYELPFGKHKRFLSNTQGLGNLLLSGWQLNGIVTLLSGFPFTPQSGSNRSGDGDTRNPDRPSLIPILQDQSYSASRRNGLIPMRFCCRRPGRGEIWAEGLTAVLAWLRSIFHFSRIRQSRSGLPCNSGRSPLTSKTAPTSPRRMRSSFRAVPLVPRPG